MSTAAPPAWVRPWWSDGARDTRKTFEGRKLSRDYPRSFRRAVAHGRWERASWLEARHAERWLSRLCRLKRERDAELRRAAARL